MAKVIKCPDVGKKYNFGAVMVKPETLSDAISGLIGLLRMFGNTEFGVTVNRLNI